MRRFVVAAGAALVVAGLIAPAAAADTTTGEADVYAVGGAYSFVERGQTFGGWAQVEVNRLTGERFASIGYTGEGTERTCEAGTEDEFTSRDTIDFSPDTTVIRELAIRPDLSRATFELRVSGVRRTYEACSGDVIASRAVRYTVEVSLRGVGDTSTDTGPVLIDNGDGTYAAGTETYSARAASARMSIDGKGATMTDALLQHVLVVRN